MVWAEVEGSRNGEDNLQWAGAWGVVARGHTKYFSEG